MLFRSYVMCGMIEDIRTFVNRRLNIGGDAALSNRNMMKAWLEASVVHGMPVQEHGFHLFSDEYPSSFPQNMAYLTAKLCCRQDEHGEPDMKRVNRYLRRVQEATAAGLKMLNDVAPTREVLTLKSYEALAKVADGKATKIIIPSDLQGMAGMATAFAETVKEQK